MQSNLRREAERRGVEPARLVFGDALPMPEYLARYRGADLFLDTLPYNAGTTASDALWAGLPVLTCVAEAFASRMAASVRFFVKLRLSNSDALRRLAARRCRMRASRSGSLPSAIAAASYCACVSVINSGSRVGSSSVDPAQATDPQ